MCLCVCVYPLACSLLTWDDLRCLFSPLQVNHGGVPAEKPPRKSVCASPTFSVRHVHNFVGSPDLSLPHIPGARLLGIAVRGFSKKIVTRNFSKKNKK